MTKSADRYAELVKRLRAWLKNNPGCDQHDELLELLEEFEKESTK